jgi:hypothetical protein
MSLFHVKSTDSIASLMSQCVNKPHLGATYAAFFPNVTKTFRFPRRDNPRSTKVEFARDDLIVRLRTEGTSPPRQ